MTDTGATPEKMDPLRVMKHDLKGPITIIKGYLSFWQSDAYTKFPPEKQKEFILNALNGADKMDSLLDETFAKIHDMRDKGEMKPFTP